MASKIQNLRNWQNNEKLNARDYKQERDKIANTVNTIIDEQGTQDGLLAGLRTDVNTNATNIGTNDTDIANLQSEKVDRAGDTITGNLTVEGTTTLGSFTASSGSIASLSVSGTNISQTVSDVIGLKNGDVRAKKAENTDDGAGNANTAAQIKQTVSHVNQDLKDTATPEFQGVVIGDKTLTNQKLVDLDAAKAHADTVTGNPHQLDKVDIGLDQVDNTADVDKPVSTATQDALDGKADLGEDGFVLPEQLPSYVDDILEFATFAELPATGATGKIYIVNSDPDPAKNTSYRWSGSAYFVFDQTTAEWGSISGTVTNQADIENATFTPNTSGITANTLKTAIQEVKGNVTGITTGVTDITFSDADLAATNLADGISEVQDNLDALDGTVDNIIAGTQNITYGATTVAGELSSLDGRLDTAEGDITSLENRMGTAEGDITSLETLTDNIVAGVQDITFGDTTVGDELTDLDSRLTTAETDIDNIEDGTTDIVFDPASSGLDSTTVEAAIKEIYAEKGVADGIATLDNTGRIPSEQLPLEAIEFKGTFGDGTSTTGGDLPTTGVTKGDLYISNTNQYNSAVAGIVFNSGDKALYDGTAWRKNDAFDAVASVNGLLGAVTINTENTSTNTTNFDGFLGANDDTVQKALDKFDDHVHTFSQITEKPTTISTFGITDAYTKTELDSGQLDGQYYTETELDNGQLDNRYYTEVESDALLANKVDVGTLSSSLILYPTNTYEVGGTFDGYAQMVTNTSDVRYNDTAVILYTTDDRTETGTSAITSENLASPSLVGALIADPGLFTGDISGINTTTIGEVAHVSGNNPAYIRYTIYNSSDMVNHIAQSEYILVSDDDTIFFETFQNAIITNANFDVDERVVIHYEAYHDGGQDPIIAIRFGGENPTRTLLPIPVSATQDARLISYDNSDSTLTETNVKTAIDELDDKLESNITVIQVESFDIINPDNGDGTFTYRDANLQNQTGTIDGEGFYEFDLQVSGFYENSNLVEVNINDATHLYGSDTDQLREGASDAEGVVTSVKIKHTFVNGDEIDVRYYQGANIATSGVSDGAISFAKLDGSLQTDILEVRAASSTNSPNTLVQRNANDEFQGILDGKFKTPRTIALDGDVVGQAQFDGSQGITIATTVAIGNYDGGSALSVFSVEDRTLEGGGA